jgi:hypothetical protein
VIEEYLAAAFKQIEETANDRITLLARMNADGATRVITSNPVPSGTHDDMLRVLGHALARQAALVARAGRCPIDDALEHIIGGARHYAEQLLVHEVIHTTIHPMKEIEEGWKGD